MSVDVDGKTYHQSVHGINKSIQELMGITAVAIPYSIDPEVVEALAKLKARKKKRDLEALIAKDQKKKKKRKHGHKHKN